jgi:hypothetical protein
VVVALMVVAVTFTPAAIVGVANEAVALMVAGVMPTPTPEALMVEVALMTVAVTVSGTAIVGEDRLATAAIVTGSATAAPLTVAVNSAAVAAIVVAITETGAAIVGAGTVAVAVIVVAVTAAAALTVAAGTVADPLITVAVTDAAPLTVGAGTVADTEIKVAVTDAAALTVAVGSVADAEMTEAVSFAPALIVAVGTVPTHAIVAGVAVAAPDIPPFKAWPSRSPVAPRTAKVAMLLPPYACETLPWLLQVVQSSVVSHATRHTEAGGDSPPVRVTSPVEPSMLSVPGLMTALPAPNAPITIMCGNSVMPLRAGRSWVIDPAESDMTARSAVVRVCPVV